jgi:hypothetical protein
MHKILYLIHDSHFRFHRKMCILLLVRCHCPPTKSNLYFDSSFGTVTSEPVIYKLLKFHVPSLLSLFHCLCRLSKESVQVRGSCLFCNRFIFYGPTPSWRTTPCRLYVAAYSMYSQLLSIAGGCPSIRNLRMCHAVVTGTPCMECDANNC